MTDANEVAAAAEAVARGDLVVLPTDTVYGIGSRPDDPRATRAIFEAKGRPRDLTLPVLVASEEQARRAAVFDRRAARLARAYWPGPLTLVLPRTERSRAWDLGGEGSSIGVRVPQHPLALDLLRRTGPLAVTSANRSGDPPASDLPALRATFGDRVSVYLLEDEPLRGEASTVLALLGPEPVILRRGPLDPSDMPEIAG